MASADAAKLKIGLVVDDTLDKPDGVQQYVLSVGEWLRGQGHDVHYLVGESSRTDVANVHSLSRNVKVRFNRNRLSMPLPSNKRKLRAFLAEQQFDVLHVQVPYSPWLAQRVILAAPQTTAIIGTFHILPYSPVVKHGARILAAWTRKSARQFDDIVSVSPAAAEFAEKTFGMKTSVVPNTFDYKVFHDAQPLPPYKEGLTILFLGRLVERKGCQLLLRAVAELQKRNVELPKYRVVICGKGPLETKLKAFVKTKNLREIVEFIGFVTEVDKPKYYASADIAVFPSSGGESFGIVLIEAMASGRAAVLAGDNPGYRSVLRARPEQLFGPHNAQELTDKLEHLLINQKDRQLAAAWGEQEAQRYDTAVVGAELLKRYRQALRKRRNS